MENQNKLEFMINSRIKKIKSNKITASESGIGKLFNKLKNIDEASYETLLIKYKSINNF